MLIPALVLYHVAWISASASVTPLLSSSSSFSRFLVLFPPLLVPLDRGGVITEQGLTC